MFGRLAFVAVISGSLATAGTAGAAPIRKAPVPDRVMSDNAARGAMLNQQALQAATNGTFDPLGRRPFSNGATIGSTGGASQGWETQQNRRVKSAYSSRRLNVFRPVKPLPAPKRTGTLGKPGPFSRRVLASAPPLAERPPAMRRIFDGPRGDGPEPAFGNLKRAMTPEQGTESHIRIMLQ